MKKISRKLSLLVCLTIIANLFVFAAPSVLASNDGVEVLYKSSFSDYTSSGTPKGWNKTKYIIQNNVETENTTSAISASSEEGHNNFISYYDTLSEVRDVIPFGKTISSGKLHISYDAKIPSSENGVEKKSSSIAVLFNARYNGGYYNSGNVTPFVNDYDPYDASDLRGGNGQNLSHLFKVLYINGQKFVSNDANGGIKWGATVEVGTTKVENNVWYHTDIIVDLDNSSYDVWTDGEKLNSASIKLKTNDGFNVFKGFGFLHQDGNKVGCYDNISVTHYTVNDKIQMVVDAGKNGIGTDSSDGKYLNVAFNDTFANNFRFDDFKITAEDGTEVTNVNLLSNYTTAHDCVLDFTAAEGLKDNTNYTVTYNANNNGTATQSNAKGASATFRTNASVVDTTKSDYKYYYAKDDFNGYTVDNQMPFGIYNPQYLPVVDNKGNVIEPISEKYNKYLSKESNFYQFTTSTDGKNGGKAVRFTDSRSAYNYYFPRGIITGDFSAEFDVKFDTSYWSIGFVPHLNWMDASIENSTNFNNLRNHNALLGMNPDHGNKLLIDTTQGANSIAFTRDGIKETGLEIASESWAHIKLDFDMAAGNVDIHVTDSDGTTTHAYDQSYGDWNKFGMGIEGLQISKFKTADDSTGYLDIDNLEVYTTSSLLLDQDFDGYTAPATTKFPYFWTSDSAIKNSVKADAFRKSNTQPQTNYNAKSAVGKSGASGDNAVEFYRSNSAGSAWYMTRFGKNVPAGQSYAVEFDLKAASNAAGWTFGPIDASRSQRLTGFNDVDDGNSAGTNQNMVFTTTFGSTDGNIYQYTKERYVAGWASPTHLKATSFNTQISDDADKTSADSWVHYKLVAVPQTSNTKYILTVDDGAKQNTYTFTDNNSAGYYKNHETDIAGIAFRINDPDITAKGEWGAIFLDNLKAYICEEDGSQITSARENSILDIEAEKLNGDTVSLMNTNEIPYSTNKITVTFSENLSEKLKEDLTPITITSGSVTGETTAVYNNIEDVIQLRSQNTSHPMDYDTVIDGNKVIITLKNALADNTTYSLHIAKNVSFASSPFTTLDTGFSKTYTGVVDPDGGFKLASCKAVVKNGTSWADVTSLNDIINNEGNLGLKFNVTNVTGADKNIRAIAAFYDESGELSDLVNIGLYEYTFASEAGAKEQVMEISIPTITEGKTYTTVKFFAWDADTQAPLKKPQSFTNITK